MRRNHPGSSCLIKFLYIVYDDDDDDNDGDDVADVVDYDANHDGFWFNAVINMSFSLITTTSVHTRVFPRFLKPILSQTSTPYNSLPI